LATWVLAGKVVMRDWRRTLTPSRLVLGGGLSFLSAQYGWVANNIVEYEIVLANASIVTASESHNADLWKALKGGINNYGIVTAYTMKAHPQGQVSMKVLGSVQWANTLAGLGR
jgi:FAD/FMN-containing dehydrogenase